MAKKKVQAPKRARAKPPPAASKNDALVAFQKNLRISVPQSPHFNDDPAIKTSFDKWTAITDQLATAVVAHGQVLAQLDPAASSVLTLRQEYWAAAQLFYTTVQGVLLDDGPGLQSFGLVLKGARGPSPAITTPLKLRIHAVKGQPGHYTVRWHLVKGAGLYEVQRSPDPEAEATFATTYNGTHAEYGDTGQPGAVLWFRVRAHGNTVSDWSAPVRYVVI
jgi:hypothetical protein